MSRDILAGAAILVFCGIVLAVTMTFDRVPAVVAQNVQPATFPRLVTFVIAALAVWLIIASLGQAAAPLKPLPMMVWLSAAVIIAFVAAFQWLGPVPAMAALCVGLPLLWGERRWYLVLPFGLAFPLLVHLLFVDVMGVHFEPSPLAFW